MIPASAAAHAVARGDAWVTAASSDAASPSSSGAPGRTSPTATARVNAPSPYERVAAWYHAAPRRRAAVARRSASPGRRMPPITLPNRSDSRAGADQPASHHVSAESTRPWVTAVTAAADSSASHWRADGDARHDERVAQRRTGDGRGHAIGTVAGLAPDLRPRHPAQQVPRPQGLQGRRAQRLLGGRMLLHRSHRVPVRVEVTICRFDHIGERSKCQPDHHHLESWTWPPPAERRPA